MSKNKPAIDLIKYFGELDDPRIDRHKLHSLPDILFIVFCGAICGVETWEDLVKKFLQIDYSAASDRALRRFD